MVLHDVLTQFQVAKKKPKFYRALIYNEGKILRISGARKKIIQFNLFSSIYD